MDFVKIDVSKIRKEDSSVDGNALASFFKKEGAMVAGRREMLDGATKIIMQIAGLSEGHVIAKLQEFLSSSSCSKPAKEYLWSNVVPEARASDVKFSEDGKKLVKCPKNLKGDFCVPEGTTSIGDCAFFDCRELTSVTIPEGVTMIGYSAFNSCFGLTSIVLPQGLKSIKDDAFSGCKSLQTITLPKSLSSIGADIFDGCKGLTEIRVAKGKKERLSKSLSKFAGIIVEE